MPFLGYSLNRHDNDKSVNDLPVRNPHQAKHCDLAAVVTFQCKGPSIFQISETLRRIRRPSKGDKCSFAPARGHREPGQCVFLGGKMVENAAAVVGTRQACTRTIKKHHNEFKVIC